MKEENSRNEILESAREHARISEENQRIQMITDAIGDRRNRDLFDLLSQLEQDNGWSETLDYLSKASIFQYSLPIGAGPTKSYLEKIKFRETIFSLLMCNGLEPVPINTEDLLSHAKKEDSFIDASNTIRGIIEPLVTKQVESGDLLFFDVNTFDSAISKKVTTIIERAQQEQIEDISLIRKNNEVDILPLWYTEIGRQTLSQIGIKGSRVDIDLLDTVLSVIHQGITITERDEDKTEQQFVYKPSNESYRTLLVSIINHDIESLCSQSSRFAFPTVKTILEEAVDHYRKEPGSEKYREVLAGINAHVRIRTIDSIGFLETLCHSKSPRIATTAITALGNFYHESAASALIDLLCETRNHEIAKITTRAILNVSKRCIETKSVIVNALGSESCTQKKFLKQLQKEIIRNHLEYYE